MAYTEAHSIPRSGVAVEGVFAALVARFKAWRSYRATFKALSQLSDAELKDIGITRCDIERLSRGAL